MIYKRGQAWAQVIARLDKKGGVGSGGGVGDKQFRMPAAAFKPNLITSSPT